MPKKNSKKLADDIEKRLSELLDNGDDRIVLAAAKELMSSFGKDAEDEKDIHLDVTIKIV